MTDEIFDPLPGDGYPDGPVDYQGNPSSGAGRVSDEPERDPAPDDVGPPAPGEFDPKDYPNPCLEMEC